MHLEVKGVNENMDWLVGGSGVFNASRKLFYALVGFEGMIKDVNHLAKYYIIPSEKLVPAYKVAANGKTVYLSHKFIRENYEDYLNTFKWLDDYLMNH